MNLFKLSTLLGELRRAERPLQFQHCFSSKMLSSFGRCVRVQCLDYAVLVCADLFRGPHLQQSVSGRLMWALVDLRLC